MPKPRSTSPSPVSLALRRAEAARALSLSVRKLDELTAQGVIPHVRIGRKVVLYPVSVLERWLDAEARKAGGSP